MNRQRSIELLNKAVGDELAAVHQYMYFHFHLADQGFVPLAVLFKQTAIREMTHIELLSERILFLKGDVEMAASEPVEKILTAEEMLGKARKMEEGSAADYNRSATECSQIADSVSKQLFESLVVDEELHYDNYDKQLDNIKRFGPSYLALQSFGAPAAATGPVGAAPAAGPPA